MVLVHYIVRPIYLGLFSWSMVVLLSATYGFLVPSFGFLIVLHHPLISAVLSTVLVGLGTVFLARYKDPVQFGLGVGFSLYFLSTMSVWVPILFALVAIPAYFMLEPKLNLLLLSEEEILGRREEEEEMEEIED